MPTSKVAKVQIEIDKTRAKIAEQQARLKELETKRTEIENMEIVDIVRGLSIPLENLGSILQSLKEGNFSNMVQTSGQVDPKSTAPKIITGNGDNIIDEEAETE